MKKIENRSRNELVYEQIKDEIINDRIKPLSKINIQEMSEAMGVSKTPIVMAISALERDGYIVVMPQSGTFVRELGLEEITALYDLRIAAEKLTLEYALQAIDPAVLIDIQQKLEHMISGVKDADDAFVEAYFSLEMQLHDYFQSCCPPVFQKITRNIVDLTKRTRLLTLSHPAGMPDDDIWLIDDINMHLSIIKAVLGGNLKTAQQLTEQDIDDTKKRVLKMQTDNKLKEDCRNGQNHLIEERAAQL